MTSRNGSGLIARTARTLTKRPLVSLTVMFCAGLAATLWHVTRLQCGLVETVAVQSARRNAEAIDEFMREGVTAHPSSRAAAREGAIESEG